MRMQTVYEAYFDDYDCLKVYMSNNFFNGQSRIFHIKDSKDQIIPLRIQSKQDLPGGYTKYVLSILGDLDIGEEYVVYDEHCQRAFCQYGHIVKTQRFNDEFTYLYSDLGCQYTPDRTTFKVWSPVAHKILLKLSMNGQETIYEMLRQAKGIFALEVNQDLLNAHYTLMVRMNGAWQETVDPYNCFCGPNTQYSVVQSFDQVSLPPKVSLPPLDSNTDAILYEASIRDLSADPGIGIQHPKTFVGFVEENLTTRSLNTGFSYIKSLGVTHIQLLPVFDFGSVDEMHTKIFYNWGYDPVHHRCLEGSYSTDCTNATCRIEEFAKLVQACHQAGLRVNLDLVFNHVYNKATYPLEVLVPNYYFLMDTEGNFSNGSFCGNDIDTQPPMARQYFLDTCRMIVERYDVDGFRFDLMGILDYTFMNEIAKECRKLKPDFMIYGEGWNMPSFVSEDLRASMQNQYKMPNVGHFNDRFRETCRGSNGDLEIKGYSNGETSLINMMETCLGGGVLNDLFDSPQKAINYVECHDNHTLWDKNQVCCQNESRGILMLRQSLANALVLLAQGVPFLHCGQEFGRTKYNLDNSYNRSDHYNHIDYSLRNKHMPIVVDTKLLIKIRKGHPCFRLRTKEEILENVRFEEIDQKVLVYKVKKDQDFCICFFNPTMQHYTYQSSEELEILFDNGNINSQYSCFINIAPYCVVVCKAPMTFWS